MTLLLFLIFTSFSYLGYVLLCCIFSVWLIALSILSSKSIHVAANADEQLSGWTTNTLQSTTQSQSCTKKRSRSLFGGLLPIWSTTAFWFPVKPYIWEVCSAHWWDAPKAAMTAPGIGQQNGPSSSPWQHPTACHTTDASKWKEFRYKVVPHPPYSTDLSLTNKYFFKHLDNFLQGKCFHNQQEAENALHKFTEAWSMDFYGTVQFSHSVLSNSLWPHGLQHTGPPYPSPTPGACSTHVHWVGNTIQPSHPVTPFSSCLQSFPASGSFQMSQFFASGGQSIGVLASGSVLRMNIQDWSPLEWTDWIALQSMGLSRVFSNTTVQKHQFFGA